MGNDKIDWSDFVEKSNYLDPQFSCYFDAANATSACLIRDALGVFMSYICSDCMRSLKTNKFRGYTLIKILTDEELAMIEVMHS